MQQAFRSHPLFNAEHRVSKLRFAGVLAYLDDLEESREVGVTSDLSEKVGRMLG